jgi:predicted Zn-dependent protease with MMP-like domain
MPKTQINCPNCRQPILAEIQQVFDAGINPQDKQTLLSGAINLATCPSCGYQGPLSTPLVYHDPEKELLLTYFPPDLVLPPNERERITGQLINQVVNNLPPEKRKGYLFNPQPALTLQGMSERILEADGITKEMIQAQQDRINLIQRLMTISNDSIVDIIEQEDSLIDEEFFVLFSTLAQAAQASNEEETIGKLVDLQEKLIEYSTFGQKLEKQNQDIEEAAQKLKELGQEVSREKLLDLIVEVSDNPTQLSAIVSMARPGLDYGFFTTMSERIAKADGEEEKKLAGLREKLLEITRRIDEQTKERLAHARQNLETLLGAEDIASATLQNLPAIDDFFLQTLEQELETAQKSGNQQRIEQLGKVVNAIQQASTPPGAQLLNDLIETPDDASLEKLMEENKDQIDEKFIELLTNVMMQLQDQENKQLKEKVRSVYRKAVRLSMQSQMSN